MPELLTVLVLVNRVRNISVSAKLAPETNNNIQYYEIFKTNI